MRKTTKGAVRTTMLKPLPKLKSHMGHAFAERFELIGPRRREGKDTKKAPRKGAARRLGGKRRQASLSKIVHPMAAGTKRNFGGWHRKNLPLVGRSKSRSAAKRFRVGATAPHRSPTRKTLRVFRPPHKGEVSLKPAHRPRRRSAGRGRWGPGPAGRRARRGWGSGPAPRS